MLNARSQNLLSDPDRENLFPSSSTRDLPFKTPARSLKRGRVAHNENAIYGHPRTAGLTGRKKNNVVFNTPAMAGPLQSRLKTDKISRTTSKSTALSEITNKTPFHNAQFPVTPGPAPLKPTKLFTILDDAPAVPSARRVSSTRKKLRLPRSASKSFETPDTRGNHWDVSDVSIEASIIEEPSITEDDYDDVEYAPSTAIDPKYDPSMDMPDYKQVGTSLMSLFGQSTIPEYYDPVAEFDDTALLAELGPLEWERVELPEIPSENIFPCMIRPDKPKTSMTASRPQSTLVRPVARSAAATPRSVMPPGPPKSSGPIALTGRKPTVPVTLLSKPANRRTTTVSHTRIPSLSKPPVAQVPPPTTQLRKPVASHSRTTSMSHSRAPSASHSRTTSMSHSRTTSIAHSRTTSISKPGPMSKRKVVDSQPKLPEDTVHSLLADPGTEVMGGDFLFEV